MRDNIKNAAILRDFLNFKHFCETSETKQFCETSSILSTSARHPQFSKLATTKTKQFCETSFKNGFECRADGLVPMRFVPLHLCKVLRLPWQSDARSCEVLHLSRKIILANLEDLMLQNATLRPDLLTSLMIMSLVLHLPRDMHLCRSSANVPRLPSVFGHATKPSCFYSLLARCTIPCACRAKRHLNVQKWSDHVVFLHFDLEMCFAPQRRTLFSTFQLPKVLRNWWVLYMLTSKCASRHNGGHFFIISTSKSASKLV